MDQLINGHLNKISLFYQLKFLSLVEALKSYSQLLHSLVAVTQLYPLLCWSAGWWVIHF